MLERCRVRYVSIVMLYISVHSFQVSGGWFTCFATIVLQQGRKPVPPGH